MKTRFAQLFLLVILFSFAIRIYAVTQNPEGFDQTEASFAYNAYSILQSGRDEYGKSFPLVLMSFGDYKLAGYSYWQIPFIALFGLNEFSARFSTITAGMISLVLIYFLVRDAFKNRKLAILTMFMTSIAPWHLLLSRMAYDPMIAFMMYLASIFFFMRWHKQRKLLFLAFSAVTLSWAIATYYAVWVLLPFTVLFYAVMILKKSETRKLLYIGIAIVVPLLMLGKLLHITKGERLYQDSTYQVHAQALLDEQIREDQQQFPLVVTRALHNKAVFYSYSLLQNLFKNLSFDFLFLQGDKFDRRFSVPYQGVLYLWSAPFLLLGILYFWKQYSVSKNILLLGGIFIIFLGSSFSEFGSETERTLFAIPLFALLISYGLFASYRLLGRRSSLLFLLGCGVLLGGNAIYFNHQYYWHANVHQPWGRDFGMRELITSLAEYKKQYEQVIIPDNVYTFYYFYNKVDPQIAWTEAQQRLSKTNFLGLTLRAKIGDYLAMPIECPAAGKLGVLYICRGTKVPLNSKIVKIIRYRDNQPAFILLEFLSAKSTEPLPQHVEALEKYGLLEATSSAYWKESSEL